MIARAVLAAVVLAASAACAAPLGPASEARRPPAVPLAACRIAGSDTEARCGMHRVFEDRVSRSGRTIPLNILVLPALTASPAGDALFVLAGGPGVGSASGVTRAVVEYFRPMRGERDVVFVDQRGTGESHRLACRMAASGAGAAGFADLLPVDRIRSCRQALEPIADLRLYTTPIAMDDLDEVRAALGYPRINLYGVSYGSLASLQYLRRYPARVRSLALVGVATPAQKLPLHFAGGAQAALDRAIADCAADAACARDFPDLRADVAAVFARFESGPVVFELSTGERSERVTLSRAVFAERLRLMLYNLPAASRVPLVLHRAARGDWVPFARATSPTLTGLLPGFAMGMYLTVTCSESIPVIGEEDIVRESRGSFVGEERTRVHVRACHEWPRGRIPQEFYAPVASPAPVLMLSGALDPATPAHFGAEAARSLPNSRQIVIRHVAHVYFDECLRDLVSDFVAMGSTRDLDVGCVETLRRPPFVAELPPPRTPR